MRNEYQFGVTHRIQKCLHTFRSVLSPSCFAIILTLNHGISQGSHVSNVMYVHIFLGIPFRKIEGTTRAFRYYYSNLNTVVIVKVILSP